MRFSSLVRSVKARIKNSLPLGNGSSYSGNHLRQPLSLLKRKKRHCSILAIERLEERITPSAPPEAIFAHIGSSYVYVSPKDINAAFSDILQASGRKQVVTYQVRKGIDDNTKGSVIDAEFTPTGLYAYDSTDNVRLPVDVQQFANYFGFDHLNWQQQVTIPSTWSAKYSSGTSLGQTFTDPQPFDIELTGNGGVTTTVTAVGDLSGLYLPGDLWKTLFVNPIPLDTNPNPPGDSNVLPIFRLSPKTPQKYWFAFEDAPEMPSSMYGTNDMLQFTTTLVGVRADGSVVSLASSYGTSFTWKSNTGANNATGVNSVGYLQTFDSPALPIRNSGGISNVQFVTTDSPAATTNPINQVVGAGSSVSFIAAAIGVPDPTVQWQVSTDGGKTFSNIARATSPTLTFTPTSAQNGNEYRAVFTNSAGSAITTAATLAVATSPIVTTNPSSQIATAGGSVSFVAAAVGSPAPTVQWQMSTDSGSTFTNLAGATSNTLTVTPTADQNDYEYRAVFTNSKGSATTLPATLTVNAQSSSLVINSTTGVFPQFKFATPPNASQDFGAQTVTLPNGNVVATDPLAGAVYLFSGETGALISTLTGAGDYVTVTVLANGNFVVDSPDASGVAGAVTWGSETTGVSGVISASNSLIGIMQGGGGSPYITPLSNGNYVVASPGWHDYVGAVTWGNGSTGTTGLVSAANSLVGSTPGGVYSSVGDDLGDGAAGSGVIALTNGNYVVDSPNWNDLHGAVTWCNGSTGTVGVVSASNSLVGSSGPPSAAADLVGSGGSDSNGVIALDNGNYVVDSPSWNTGAGAVTWGDGTKGIRGAVSSANSLVGSRSGIAPDNVGQSVIALTNGNYVVDSPIWNEFTGAVTWGNGLTGITGPVSADNSLIGSSQADEVYEMGSGGVTALTNGNYVVDSPGWGVVDPTIGFEDLGAVTWCNGASGATGTVSAANSLIGSTPGDNVGSFSLSAGFGTGVIALTTGNYVVDSPSWNHSAGAVTWGDGTTGIVGVVSANNSLVGSTPTDKVGNYGVTALTNGNYVVASPNWGYNQGAVTWANGATGITGTISATNSLVGNDLSSDQIGDFGINQSVIALSNGNYFVVSPDWNSGEGAVTWGDGTTAINGTVSSSNSLIKVAHSSNGGTFVTSLPNGNYFVIVNNGFGAETATWVDGMDGTTLDGQNSSDSQNSMTAGGVSPIGSGDTFAASSTTSDSDGNFFLSVSTGTSDPNQLTYTFGEGQTINVTPDFITRALDAGINVTLQSNNDIVINSPIIENPTVTPGNLTLEAGRSIILNGNINTAGGNLTLIANDSKADGVVDSERDPGDAVITEQSGAAIDTGTGTLTVDLKNGTDKTNNGVGTVTLPSVNASSETLSSNSTVGIAINGTAPGDGVTNGTYTQLNVSGAINLNGAPLAITHSAVTAKGTTFIIVQSTDGVSGTFNGLNEGTTVTASDGTEFTISYKGNGGKEVVLTQVTPTPQAPAFTNPTATSFTVGSLGSFKVTASGYPEPTLSESSSDTLPKGVAFNKDTGVLSGTPAAGSRGTYTLNFTATNSLGSVSQTFMLTVNQAPAITGNGSPNFTVGLFGSFPVIVTGSPTPTLTESGALPSGIFFTDNGDGTDSLAGTPAAGTAGTYHFSITAHNGVGSDFTKNFTLTVSQPQAPFITSVSSAAFIIGHGGSFTVTATGSPTPSLTESGALPSGVAFTDHGNGTATLGGTPAAGTKGTYQINITAENGLGSAYTQGFILTVNLPPPPPPPPPVLPPPHPVLPPPPPHPPIVPPLLALFNQFLGDLETVDANGTTITDSLFGFPMVETYDYFGNLVSVTLLGFNVTFLFG